MSPKVNYYTSTADLTNYSNRSSSASPDSFPELVGKGIVIHQDQSMIFYPQEMPPKPDQSIKPKK